MGALLRLAHSVGVDLRAILVCCLGGGEVCGEEVLGCAGLVWWFGGRLLAACAARAWWNAWSSSG